MMNIFFKNHFGFVLDFLKLQPGTKEYKAALKLLLECMPDAENCDAHARKWLRIHEFALAGGILLFVLMVLLAVAMKLALLVWTMLAAMWACILLLLYAHMRYKRASEQWIIREVRSFSDCLARYSSDQIARMLAALKYYPPFATRREAPTEGDTVGCCNCVSIFPAQSVPLEEDAFHYSECPKCTAIELVFGSAEQPLTIETLQNIHNLFYENDLFDDLPDEE